MKMTTLDQRKSTIDFFCHGDLDLIISGQFYEFGLLIQNDWKCFDFFLLVYQIEKGFDLNCVTKFPVAYMIEINKKDEGKKVKEVNKGER